MKKLNEMTTADWKTLIENNCALNASLYEMAIHDGYLWLDEYLCGCAENYSIGGRGEHFTIKTVGKFEEWLDGVQRVYCLLNPTAEDKARKYIHYARIEEEMVYKNVKQEDWENVIELMMNYKEEAEQAILERLTAELNIENEMLIDFVDRWVEENIECEHNAFVDGNNIIEHIPTYVVQARDVTIV